MQSAGNLLSVTKENKVLHVLCTRLKKAFPGEVSQRSKDSLKFRSWFLVTAGIRRQNSSKKDRVMAGMNSGYFALNGQSPSS